MNKAASAVAVTYSYTSSASTVASVDAAGVVTAVAPGVATITVTAAGTGTGFTATTLTGAATVTVTALPSGLTSLTVAPATLSLNIGGTGTIVASATQPSGAAAATYTYASSATGVATVSATGVVTAVAAGSAVITVTATSAANTNFAAATLTSAVAVTVAPAPPAPQVAITYVNSSTTFGIVPVDVNNVSGQIQIGTNVTTNGNNVSALQVYACPVSQATCPAAGQTAVATQSFGAGGATSGAIEFSVNTAAFAVASDWSSSTVNFANGQTRLMAVLTVAGTSASTANATSTVLNMNNTDGFAVRYTAPANSALNANGDRWFGGPGAAGRGSVAITPVIYTAGRSIATVSSNLTNNATCSTGGSATAAGNGTVTFAAATARPWSYTFGATLGTSTGANATNVVCAGEGNSVVPAITASVDNNNVSMGTTILSTTAMTPAVTVPVAIRGDWKTPLNDGVYTFNAASGNQVVTPGSTWIGATYNFATPTAATVNFTATEAGVGLKTTPKLEIQGCGSTTFTLLTTNTAADVAECGSDLSATAYTIRYTPEDLLGNTQVYTSATGTNPAAATASKTFGVDKTAPVVRLSASTDANGAIYATAATDTVFSAEAIDDRAGLNLAGVAVARAANRAFGASTASAARLGQCVVGTYSVTGATNAGAAFISNPNCTPSGTATFGGALADGYRMITTAYHTAADLNTLGADGYYTQQVRVYDRAGNVAVTDKRYVLVNAGASTITQDALVGIFSATAAPTITGATSGTVEIASNALNLDYTTASFSYPAVATVRTAFDDVAIASSDAFSLTTPFTSGTTFYTTLEQTNINGSLNSTAILPAGARVIATTFSGVASVSAAQSFLTSIIYADAVSWGTSNTAATTKGGANITSFAVVDSTAGFNSPAGGLKVRLVTTSAQTSSPFTRIDLYVSDATGGMSYAGSVDASAAPCTSGTCSVYVADNGLSKTWTYVLRTAGRDALGNQIRWRGTAEITALNAAIPAPPVPFVASNIIAVAVGRNTVLSTGAVSAAGRGLLTQMFTLP